MYVKSVSHFMSSCANMVETHLSLEALLEWLSSLLVDGGGEGLCPAVGCGGEGVALDDLVCIRERVVYDGDVVAGRCRERSMVWMLLTLVYVSFLVLLGRCCNSHTSD